MDSIRAMLWVCSMIVVLYLGLVGLFRSLEWIQKRWQTWRQMKEG